MMNSDLIVTYFRLHEQVEKVRANNDGSVALRARGSK